MKRWRNYKRLMVAASVLLLSFLSYRLIDIWRSDVLGDDLVKQRIVSNPNGQKSRVKLPDGTLVYLNSGSSLAFPERFSDTLRLVELQGEAFFDVVRNENSPFIVKTRGINTRVLGTSFNIKAYGNEALIDVSLVEGKVQVIDDKQRHQDYFLEPGQRLTYNSDQQTFDKGTFVEMDVIGWKDGVLVFKSTDFDDFVRDIERWYGVSVTVESPPTRRWSVNGHFKNESLEEVLMGVKFTHDIEFQIKEKDVTLKCK